jgi:hypothetical protein
VLNESYEAVGRPPELKGKMPFENPVKVFVEDKLITSEGYRTKYALTERDETLRPGIEVLKNKYFIRDDGKAVELTHDVLAPIIKADREKRKKKIAAAEANKKAWRIGGIIILFMGLSGAAWWLWANHKRDEAKAEETKALIEVKKASDLKDTLMNHIGSLVKDSIRLATNNHNGGSQGFPSIPANPIPLPGSVAVDSSRGKLTTLKDRIESLRNNLELLNTQILQLNTTNRSLLSGNQSLIGNNVDLVKKNSALQSQIDNDKALLTQWRINFEKLQLEYSNYKLLHPFLYPNPNVDEITNIAIGSNKNSIADDLDSNSLKLKFNKKHNTNKPGTFNVYLIPDSSYNRSILKQAEYYDLRTNEDKLFPNAKAGIRKAKFSDGYYYFPNLPVGKYLIKVCTYYGNFQKYIKGKTGTETVPIDTSPPIR